MKRKMLFFERFMYIDGVTPINCVMSARVRGSIVPANLRTALLKIQAKHPLLRARAVEEADGPYFIFDDTPEIPVRIVERQTDDDWQSVTVAEWKVPFDTKSGPLLRIIWIRSEEVSDLMVVAHHCICDGGAIITLLREILQVADQPEMELTPYTSYASLEDIVPHEILHDAKTIRKMKRKAAFYKLFLAIMGRKATTLDAGDPYVLYWKACAEQFAAINHRCSAENTTYNAALCVAFLQAFREILGKRAKNKIVCPVSMRRYVRSIKSDMMFSIAPIIGLSLGKNLQSGFWQLARDIKHSTAEKIEALGLKVYEDLMVCDHISASVPNLINFMRSNKGGHDLAFSNLGHLKIPTKYRTFTVETITGATICVPWRNTNTLVASNFLGELVLGFISNERFLPQREAVAIQERALQLLNNAMEQPISATPII